MTHYAHFSAYKKKYCYIIKKVAKNIRRVNQIDGDDALHFTGNTEVPVASVMVDTTIESVILPVWLQPNPSSKGVYRKAKEILGGDGNKYIRWEK